VVHANSWQGFAFKRRGLPLVVTEHQYVAHPEFAPYKTIAQSVYHRFFCERWIRHSYDVADAITSVSESSAIVMRRDTAKDIHVVHNWIDANQFHPAGGNESGAAGVRSAHRPFRLLFVGNPSRRKGADLLPEIATRLGPSFELYCLGGLRGGFDKKKRPANIRLLPPQAPDAMPSIYHQVDAVLVPTRYEPFGYVALEAMACGLPVIGFASTGTAEICLNGDTALLSPLNDLETLIDNALQIQADRVLRARLGIAGRKRAIEDFSEVRAITSYVHIYRALKG
jgi:glycosyltransferase involved in cell wall biosynthesis